MNCNALLTGMAFLVNGTQANAAPHSAVGSNEHSHIHIAIVGGPSKDPLVEWRRSEWVERSEYMKK